MKSEREGEFLPLEEPESPVVSEPQPDPNEVINIRDIVAGDIPDSEKRAALDSAYRAAHDKEVLAPQREAEEQRRALIAELESPENKQKFRDAIKNSKNAAEHRRVLDAQWSKITQAYGR